MIDRQTNLLYFDKPAARFDRALPIGNGRLGAMVYGQVAEECLLLNESGMWSGSTQKSDRQGANTALPEIRQLLLNGENKKAEELFRANFTCVGKGTGLGRGARSQYGCYQMMGWLRLSYFHMLSFSRQGYDHMDAYRRTLDLSNAVAKVSFPAGKNEFTREYFASKPDDVIVIRLSASEPFSINAGIGLDRPECRRVEIESDDTIVMHGALSDGTGAEGVKYACAVKVVADGGSVYSECERVYISGANEAIIIVGAATDMSGFAGARGVTDVRQQALCDVEAAAQKSWQELLRAHVQDYSSLYRRVKLCFDKDTAFDDKPLPERIRAAASCSGDTGLAELYFHYARYLLISCSRNGCMPANLQGIWAEEIQTPWNGDWHLNAQQMIYWLAERGNLSECHMPYIELTRGLRKPGAETARTYYNARGWVVHTCTNPWGFTSPCEDVSWGSTIGSGAWQCHHLWEHYVYTNDDAYLKDIYCVLKDAALFYLDILVREPVNGRLVTAPTSSPENSFYTKDGEICALCIGSSYDTQLVKSLFSYCIKAGERLGVDDAFGKELQETIEQMPSIEIGTDGRIKEWLEEYGEPFPYHRHLSHLWGMFPGWMISTEKTPLLAAAAEKSLASRGKTTAGWAVAYRMCLWAKLKNAEKTWRFFGEAIRCATACNLFNLAYHCDETLAEPLLPDIENGRYPFQIDGNMGVATGIALMLLDDEIEICDNGDIKVTILPLPALPNQLSGGSVTGLCAKGGLTVDMIWQNMRLQSITLHAARQVSVAIRYKNDILRAELEKDTRQTFSYI